MSRHNRKVSTSLFYHFTQDICESACEWAKGRVVSVLEGGYNARALLSGTIAHITCLVDGVSAVVKDNSGETWWSSKNVQMVRISGDGRLSWRLARNGQLQKLDKKRCGPISLLGTVDANPPTTSRSHCDTVSYADH